ncbi:hypothetical protein WJX84_012101 [Apatococcus fuscideae]|uniref:Carbamoyl phosphate synthase small chain, chloroplastic n=1 Tax=Apatococcus fuscideae TaxID=2026836 RepID=A0AAW1TA83_9CHLO
MEAFAGLGSSVASSSRGVSAVHGSLHAPQGVPSRLDAPQQSQPIFAGKARCPQLLKASCGRSSGRRRSLVVRAEAGLTPPWVTPDARLVLSDGSVWHGNAFGATGTSVGEVVFNTSLTGYQEILTDPSYKGQFVTFTHPHIGNTGINPEDMESEKCHLGGIIVRDLSCVVSNYRSKQSLSDYCASQDVMGIANVDTRAITRRLRDDGCLNGVICNDASISDEELLKKTKEWSIVGQDLVAQVTCHEAYEWKDPTGENWEYRMAIAADNGSTSKEPLHVVAYDFGTKHNILRRLASHGCKITVVPADYPADKVIGLNPDGVFLSNGPGDPSALPYAVDATKSLLGKKPIFGICMGHQILGQAIGGSTFKLKFGHHGGNHPIRHDSTGRIEISAQNHNYAVNPDTFQSGVEVSHVNLNDGTCAGIVVPALQAMGIQYHPEASPGPHDADICFSQFVDMMKAYKSGANPEQVAAQALKKAEAAAEKAPSGVLAEAA